MDAGPLIKREIRNFGIIERYFVTRCSGRGGSDDVRLRYVAVAGTDDGK